MRVNHPRPRSPRHPPRWRWGVLALPLLLGGCNTTGTATTLINAAQSGNLAGAVETLARQAARHYAANPQQAVRDLKAFRDQVARFLRLVRGEWGEDNAATPTPKRYVKYTHNYLSRAQVDFDRGVVLVETLDRERPEVRLREALITTLLTPDDPRGVDMYSDAPVKLAGEPYLYRQVLDQRGEPMGNPQQAGAFADHLIRTALQRSTLETPRGPRPRHFVTFPMVADHLAIRAARYRDVIATQAAAQGVSRSLIYAVIKTESDFNPFAVSSVPAYGLMQIVPHSAGREMYRELHGVDAVPGRDYLFDPANNIRMGAGYLGRLQRAYLGRVGDPLAREYCAIAAYNGGIGRLLRLFHSDRTRALAIIDGLTPAALYQRLQQGMPAETRTYLRRVVENQRAFVGV